MFIFSNLAISLDGKIATASRGLFPLGTPEDRKQMIRLRRGADAILTGAETLRAWKKPYSAPGAPIPPTNVILSSELKGISPSWPFFREKGIPRILFVSSRIPKSRIRPFEKSSELIVLKKPTKRISVARQVIRSLEERGVKRLLVEGGGGMMWDFARENLIDEYRVTLTPRILGGRTAPTLVDGEGFSPKDSLELRLAQAKVIGDEIYLIYRKRERGQRRR